MNNNTFDKTDAILTGVVAGILALAALGVASVRTVDAGQVGIVTRFGEVNRIVDSGLAIKIPFAEKLTKMDTRVQKMETKTSASTKDLQDVDAVVVLNYSIDRESALRIYKDLGKDYSGTIITPALHESFKAGSAQYTAEQLITKRAEAKEQILAVLKDRLDDYGIIVTDLNITNFTFSKEFDAAVEAKMIAQQQVETAKQELEKAKVEAEKKITTAEAEAEVRKLQQQTLTDLMIKKVWIEKWDGHLPDVVSSDSGLMLNMGE